MKFVRFPAAFFFFFLVVLQCPLPAEDKVSTPDLVKQLQETMDDYGKKQKEKTAANEGEQERFNQSSAYLSRWTPAIRQAVARGDLNSLQQILREIQSVFPDDKIQKASDELMARVQDEMAAKEKTYTDTVDNAVQKAVQTAFAAKTPKDLDNSIIELSQLSQRFGEYSSGELVRRSSEKARSASSFLCQWQDYLAQMQSGNTSAAQNVLKNISQNTPSYSFVSRSEILSRINAESAPGKESPSEIPDFKGKTLKDLDKLRREISALADKSPNRNELERLSESLEAVQRAQSDFESGLIGKTFYFCTSQSDSSRPGVAPFRQELLLEVLPVYLNVTKTYPVKEGEAPAEYLLRVIKDAKDKGDWTNVWKTLDTYRLVAFSTGQSPGWLSADIQGCSSYISAQNFEKAGQFVDAVRYYKRVLAQPGENIPANEATARLSALQKDHPDDYNTAVSNASSQAARDANQSR